MAWTEITRPKYQRDELRYASDTTDEEWALIEPHTPAAGVLRANGGRHRLRCPSNDGRTTCRVRRSS
jgi:hypothetical protein